MSSSVASTTGSFIVDSSLGRYTRFGVYVEDEDDHLIKSVTFRDGQGVEDGPYTSMASTYDNINLKVVNFPVGKEPPFDQVRSRRQELKVCGMESKHNSRYKLKSQ